MFSKIRNRVTYANVAMTVALVFLTTGGAYAAGKYVITSTKQISPKVLKSLQGKPGKTGSAGATGATGAQGPVGAQGPGGAQGPKGETGAEGKEGKEGKAGKEGSPWTAGGTLPKEKTEKGEWSLIAKASGAFVTIASSVSFGIPLAAAPTAHYIRTTGKEPFYNPTTKMEEERSQEACPGSAVEPEASPGSLCVYASHEGNTQTVSPFPGLAAPQPVICPFGTGGTCLFEPTTRGGKADSFGFGILTASKEEGVVEVVGSWAVTAP